MKDDNRMGRKGSRVVDGKGKERMQRVLTNPKIFQSWCVKKRLSTKTFLRK